jgi:Tol biopolymer transport system component
MPSRVCLLGVLLGAAVAATSGSAAAVRSEPFAGSVLVTGGPGYGIYAINAAGGPLKLLVPGPVAETAAWSPDGRELAFVRLEISKREGFDVPGILEVVGADGTGVRQLAELPNAELPSFVWSPDSRRIAYGEGFGTASEVHLVGADGSGDRLLVRGASTPGSWSPDGTKLAFTRGAGNETALFTVDTRLPRPHHRPHVARITHGVSVFSTPSWSPDGRRVAFYPCCVHGYDIVDLASGKLRQYRQGHVAVPLWSPDGKWLALTGEGVSIVRPNGRDLHTLLGIDFTNLQWSPDSRALAGNSLDTGEVWVTAADGSARQQLTHASQFDYFNWAQGWQPRGWEAARLAGKTVPPETPTDSVAEGFTLRTSKPITRISASGDAVAIQYPPPTDGSPGFFDGPTPAACTEVWDAGTGTITRFPGNVGCTYNTLTDHSHVSIDGDQLAWASGPAHTLGVDDWSIKTATLENLRRTYVSVDGLTAGYGPVSDVVAGDGLTVFETWASPCSSLQPGCNPPPRPIRNGRLFRVVGTTATLVASSEGALTPLSVDAGRILVDHENGTLDVDGSDGSTRTPITLGPPLVTADNPSPPLQGCLNGNDVVVLADGYLAHYDATTGALLGRPVLRDGTLDGCASGIVATASRTLITLTRFSDGATATIDTGGTPTPEPGPPIPGTTSAVPAQLDGAGLFYAWNTNDISYPGRATFIPTAELPLQHPQ